MKDLETLIHAYKQSMTDNNTSYTNLTLLQKQRMSIYRKYRDAIDSMNSTDILAECDAYIQYLQSVLSNPNTPQAKYPYIVAIASTVHNPTTPYLKEDDMLQVIDNEMVALKGVLDGFRPNPMKAGRKVRDTKTALKELKELRQEIESPVA